MNPYNFRTAVLLLLVGFQITAFGFLFEAYTSGEEGDNEIEEPPR